MAFTITIPAADMKDRATGIRRVIVDQYLRPQKPFPLTALVASASMAPTSASATQTLISRGAIQTAGGHLKNSGTAFDAPFKALMNGQTIRITVAIPHDIDWTVDMGNDHLTIASPAGLLITFIDKPTINGVEAPISDRQRLKRVDLRDLSMTYELQDDADPSSAVIIKLDFTQRRAGLLPTERPRGGILLGGILALMATLVFLNGCNAKSTTPAAFPGSLACSPLSLANGGTSTCTVTMARNAPGGNDTIALSCDNALLRVPASVTVAVPDQSASGCASSPTPGGYVIVGYEQSFNCSNDASVHGLAQYQRYVDRNPGESLTVCPPQTIPDNTWTSAGGTPTIGCMTNSFQTPVPSSTIITKVSGSAVPPPTATFTASVTGNIPSNQSATVTATLGGASVSAAISLLAH